MEEACTELDLRLAAGTSGSTFLEHRSSLKLLSDPGSVYELESPKAELGRESRPNSIVMLKRNLPDTHNSSLACENPTQEFHSPSLYLCTFESSLGMN